MIVNGTVGTRDVICSNKQRRAITQNYLCEKQVQHEGEGQGQREGEVCIGSLSQMVRYSLVLSEITGALSSAAMVLVSY